MSVTVSFMIWKMEAKFTDTISPLIFHTLWDASELNPKEYLDKVDVIKTVYKSHAVT